MRNLSVIKSLHHKKITAILFLITIIITFSVASETFPVDSGTEYQKALQYYNSRKYKEAVRLFKEYAKKKPDATVYYRIGYALYQLHEFDEANRYFREAYLIDPGFSPGPIRPPQEYPQEKKKTDEPAIKQDTSKKESDILPPKEKQPAVKHNLRNHRRQALHLHL
jgi:TolA-binding protein